VHSDDNPLARIVQEQDAVLGATKLSRRATFIVNASLASVIKSAVI
jgi:hypothetical protein